MEDIRYFDSIPEGFFFLNLNFEKKSADIKHGNLPSIQTYKLNETKNKVPAQVRSCGCWFCVVITVVLKFQT